MTAAIAPELHLFIIWDNARSSQTEILVDLGARFRIVQQWTVNWSAKTFDANVVRFYGVALPAGIAKGEYIGRGPFTLVVVEDASPEHGSVETSKGSAIVNTRVFAAKQRYRDWTGGGHKVHSTNTVAEFNHDIALLLGANTEDFRSGSGSPYSVDFSGSTLSNDLSGAHGWTDLKHFFYILDATVPFVVMRNFDPLPENYYADLHGDIDLLVNDYEEAASVARSKKVFKKKNRVHVRVPIGGEQILFDFRFIGDNYYDEPWQQDILSSRSYVRGMPVPDPEQHFYSLLYHALLHKPAIADDYVTAFRTMSPVDIVKADGSLDITGASRLLGSWLAKRGYEIKRAEPSVFNHQQHVEMVRKAMWRARPVQRTRIALTRRLRREQ